MRIPQNQPERVLLKVLVTIIPDANIALDIVLHMGTTSLEVPVL